jgi:hypothetical protein
MLVGRVTEKALGSHVCGWEENIKIRFHKKSK